VFPQSIGLSAVSPLRVSRSRIQSDSAQRQRFNLLNELRDEDAVAASAALRG
jgi:hypothetical protein